MVTICKFGGGPIRRHDHFLLLDSFYDMLQSVNYRCRKELTSPFEGKQRPDITVYNYRDSKRLLDITITHPWSKTNLTGSSEKAGFAASAKEKEKDEKYLLKANSLWTPPSAIGVFGRWGKRAEETLKKLSLLAPPVLNMPCDQFKRTWAIQLAVCLQKENSDIIVTRLSALSGKSQLRQLSCQLRILGF